jgi:hypothetical protein
MKITCIENNQIFLNLDSYSKKSGKWLIDRFEIKISKDPWYLTAVKITAIILGSFVSLALACPTFGLSIVLPLYLLYKGYKAGNLNQKDQKVNTSYLAKQSKIDHLPVLKVLKPSNANCSNIASKPVGIINSENNCYFNVAVQFIMNTPEFFEAAKRIGKKNPAYKALIKDYEEYQKTNAALSSGTIIALPSGNDSAYRNFHSDINKRHNNEFPLYSQCCVSKLISCLINDIEYYEVPSPLLQKRVLSETNEIIIVNNYVDTYAEDPALEIGEGLSRQIEGFYKYLEPPKYFVISENAVAGVRENPLFFILPQIAIQNYDKPAAYECTFFGIHAGQINVGHYWCCIKVNNIWYELNDDYVTVLNEKSALKKAIESEIQISHFVLVE